MLLRLFLLASFLALPATVADLFCGDRDCYEILEIARTATAREITKAYHKLNKNKALDAATKFIAISTAYEVLHDEETRKEYDNVLANPDALYAKYGAYVRFRYKQTNVWIVLLGLVVVATVGHYLYWWSRYLLVRRHISQDPRVLARMKAKAKKDLEDDSLGKKTKKAVKEELEAKVKEQSLEDFVQVTGWQGRPPKLTDILLFTIFWTPWTIWCYIYWFFRWQIKFNLLHHPFGPEERLYQTAAVLGVPASRFAHELPPERQQFFLDKQLWVPENFADFRKEMRARKRKY